MGTTTELSTRDGFAFFANVKDMKTHNLPLQQNLKLANAIDEVIFGVY